MQTKKQQLLDLAAEFDAIDACWYPEEHTGLIHGVPVTEAEANTRGERAIELFREFCPGAVIDERTTFDDLANSARRLTDTCEC